jgi:hypothetical protein
MLFSMKTPKKTPKKKPGRPPKKRPEQPQEYWNKQLHNKRLGLNRAEPKWQVLECNLVNKNGETVTLESLGRGESITQQTDALASTYQEAGADESTVLSADWQRSLEYMYIIAELKSPEDLGAALKKLMLESARSRCTEQPIDFSCAGTPAEFRARCAESHVEIQLELPVINIIGYPQSPDNY